MNEFTIGPWRYDNYGTGIMGIGKGGIHETEEEFLVAGIRGWGHLQYLGHDKAVAIQEANAHLISAAPDMYEALKEAKDILIALGIDSGNYNQMYQVRKIGQEIAQKCTEAIAKAEGK